jgi:hypothetical protein
MLRSPSQHSQTHCSLSFIVEYSSPPLEFAVSSLVPLLNANQRIGLVYLFKSAMKDANLVLIPERFRVVESANRRVVR